MSELSVVSTIYGEEHEEKLRRRRERETAEQRDEHERCRKRRVADKDAE